MIRGMIGGVVDYLEYKGFAEVYVEIDNYRVKSTDPSGLYVSVEDVKQEDCSSGECYSTIVNIEYKLGVNDNIYSGYDVVDEIRREISYTRYILDSYEYIIKGVDNLRGIEDSIRLRVYMEVRREY